MTVVELHELAISELDKHRRQPAGAAGASHLLSAEDYARRALALAVERAASTRTVAMLSQSHASILAQLERFDDARQTLSTALACACLDPTDARALREVQEYVDYQQSSTTFRADRGAPVESSTQDDSNEPGETPSSAPVGENSTPQPAPMFDVQPFGSLMSKADVRSLAVITGYFAVLAAAYVVPFPSILTLAISACTLTALAVSVARVAHNESHSRMFRNRRLERALQVVLTIATGGSITLSAWVHSRCHHLDLQGPNDIYRTSRVRFRWNLLNFVAYPFVVLAAITVTKFDLERRLRGRTIASVRIVRERIALMLFAGGALLMDVERFILVYCVPIAVANIVTISFNYLHHDDCDAGHRYNHSRNFGGRIFNWWTFNAGFNTIHMLRPGLCWSKLPEAHAAVVQPVNDPLLNVNSLTKYLWRTFIWPAKRGAIHIDRADIAPNSASAAHVTAATERVG